jgi:hypothetical protein
MTATDVVNGSELEESSTVVSFLADLLGGFKKQKPETNQELTASVM